jgi:hypothetical protein
MLSDWWGELAALRESDLLGPPKTRKQLAREMKTRKQLARETRKQLAREMFERELEEIDDLQMQLSCNSLVHGCNVYYVCTENYNEPSFEQWYREYGREETIGSSDEDTTSNSDEEWSDPEFITEDGYRLEVGDEVYVKSKSSKTGLYQAIVVGCNAVGTYDVKHCNNQLRRNVSYKLLTLEDANLGLMPYGWDEKNKEFRCKPGCKVCIDRFDSRRDGTVLFVHVDGSLNIKYDDGTVQSNVLEEFHIIDEEEEEESEEKEEIKKEL